MDELKLTSKQLHEMEEVEKKFLARIDFPCAYFGKQQISFNTLCSPVIEHMEAIRRYATGEYIIGLPASRSDKNSFYVRQNTRSKNNYSTTVPASLRITKRIGEGYFRVYKYKDGIAIKRFEAIEI